MHLLKRLTFTRRKSYDPNLVGWIAHIPTLKTSHLSCQHRYAIDRPMDASSL